MPLLNVDGSGSASVAPFDGLSAEDWTALRELGVVRRHPRGAYLILEGEPSDHVLLVRAGRLKIVCTSDEGRESLIAVRGANEVVGEMNALGGSDAGRAASVVALDDVTVQSIRADEFRAFLSARPVAGLGLMRALVLRLREATFRQAEAAGYDSSRRVARVLLDQAERGGRVVDGGVVVAEGLSQGDLAGLVAASPKSVTRALAALRARSLVTTGRRSIIVHDLAGLRRYAG